MKVIPYEGKLALQSKFSPAVVRLCKETPGCKWSPVDKVWYGYLDAIHCVVEKLKAEGIVVEYDQDFPDHDYLTGPLPAALRGYQTQAMDFMLSRGEEGCVVALDMGLGKTRCALEYMKLIGGHWMVVCPAYVAGVWRAEYDKWLGKYWDEGKPTIEIVSYDSLHKRVGSFQGVGMVLDECHVLVEEKSRRSRSCRELREKCKYAIGLTGTPLTGKLKAAWNSIDTLSPGRLGSFFRFGMRYCAGHVETVNFLAEGPKTFYKWDGRSNEEELAARFKHFVFRRTRSEVAADLPAKTRQVVKLEVDVPKLTLPSLTPALFRTVMDAVVDKKLPEALRCIEGHAETEANVVVFTYRKAVAEKIAGEMLAAGYSAAYLHGDISSEKRTEMLKDPPQILCCTIDAAGTGISMTFASVMIFVEFTYESYKLLQAEARAHRIGQVNPVLIQYLLAAGTIEERVVETLIAKLDTEEAVLGPGDSGLATDLRSGQESEEEAFGAIAAGLLDFTG